MATELKTELFELQFDLTRTHTHCQI